MNIERIKYPAVGVALGGLLGFGLAELFVEDDAYLTQVSAIQECQADLADTPQQVPELSENCQQFKDYFAYNYDKGNYYVPAADEADSFIYMPTSEDDARSEKMIKGAFVLIFATVGAYSGREIRRIRDQTESAL